jgi:hypothetical protein
VRLRLSVSWIRIEARSEQSHQESVNIRSTRRHSMLPMLRVSNDDSFRFKILADGEYLWIYEINEGNWMYEFLWIVPRPGSMTIW